MNTLKNQKFYTYLPTLLSNQTFGVSHTGIFTNQVIKGQLFNSTYYKLYIEGKNVGQGTPGPPMRKDVIFES